VRECLPTKGSQSFSPKGDGRLAAAVELIVKRLTVSVAEEVLAVPTDRCTTDLPAIAVKAKPERRAMAARLHAGRQFSTQSGDSLRITAQKSDRRRVGRALHELRDVVGRKPIEVDDVNGRHQRQQCGQILVDRKSIPYAVNGFNSFPGCVEGCGTRPSPCRRIGAFRRLTAPRHHYRNSGDRFSSRPSLVRNSRTSSSYRARFS